jgi:hypothetical protein
MIWSLTADSTEQPGTLWAGCMPAGLFKSEDAGQSWVLNTALWENPKRLGWFGGGNDYPGIHSVLVDHVMPGTSPWPCPVVVSGKALMVASRGC